MNTTTNVEAPSWAVVVQSVAECDSTGFEQLYRRLEGIRLTLRRQLGPDRANDLYHETIVEIVEQIRRGDLREPECLAAYARAVAFHKTAKAIHEMIWARQQGSSEEVGWLAGRIESPEQAVISQEQTAIARRVLRAMKPKEREVLTRFYLDGERAEDIQEALHITETQFRLIKSRAKDRFTRLCRARFGVRKAGGSRAGCFRPLSQVEVP
jgi:RNA polymerase sigma factor (sigma-70 family)